MTRPQLRPDYQVPLVRRVRAAWAQGARNVLMRAACGAGKTVMLGIIVDEEPGPSCVIAHRHTLVGQLSLTLARYGVRHDLIASAATKRSISALHVKKLGQSFVTPGARCKVASVDTLVKRVAAVEAWARTVRLWVVDEGHHLVLDNKWHKAVKMFTHPDVRGLLPTATPERADGKGLGSPALGGDGVADAMVEGPAERWLIEEGWLCDYDVASAPSHYHLTEADLGADGDYSQPKVRAESKSHRAEIVGDVVAQYRKHALGRLTICFTVDVDEAHDIAAAYNAAGIPASILTWDTDQDLRDQILTRFERRELLVIVAVDVVSEGYDLPNLECVQLARPSKSRSLIRQQTWRAGRPIWAPGYDLETRAGRLAAIAASIKPRFLILDHVGVIADPAIGPPDKHVAWSLARRDKKSRGASDAIPLRPCTCTGVDCTDAHRGGTQATGMGCYLAYERFHTSCPHCGHIPTPAGRSSPEQVEGDLELLDPAVLDRLRGVVAEVDRSADEVRQHYAATGLPDMLVRAQVNRHAERCEAQERLRAAIAAWGGARLGEGLGHRERQKLFMLTYGVDVLSARGLGRAESEALLVRLNVR